MHPSARHLLPPVLLLVLAAPALADDKDKTKDKTLAAELQPFVDSKTLAGAVLLVANKDRVVTHEALGSADLANNKAMKPDSMFWIASMTKPITATALMILVDEGKVKLDDPVSKYLPEFAEMWQVAEADKDRIVLQKPKKPVTVRQVLMHTSGMMGNSRLENPKLDALAMRDRILSYVITPLMTEPGTKWSYSNMGINTAGRIIEVVAKMPYEKFLQERLFDPLEMKDTTFWPDTRQEARIAKSYKPNKVKDGLEETQITHLTYPLTDRKRQSMPAGGLFSTASDLSSFCRMILSGGKLSEKRYLSEKAVKEMTSLQTGDLPQSFGLGWAVDKKGAGFGHGGAYGTNMTIDPKNGLVLVYLIQHTGGFPGKDGGKIFPKFVETAKAKYSK